jgi:hypothetical protein
MAADSRRVTRGRWRAAERTATHRLVRTVREERLVLSGSVRRDLDDEVRDYFEQFWQQSLDRFRAAASQPIQEET